jgi:hypothetical protein
LLRGDMTGRYNALQTAIQGTFMTPNEARASEEMDPVPNGDNLLVPPNYTSLGVQDIAALGGAGGGSAGGNGNGGGSRPKSPSKSPGSGTLPMPPVGGGEHSGGRGRDGAPPGYEYTSEGALIRPDDGSDSIATYEREMRVAYHNHGKSPAMLSDEE